MTTQNFTSLFLFVGLLIAVSPLIARYIHLILEGQSPRLYRFDNFCERLTGFSNRTAMTGISYFKSLLVFNLIGIVFLMLLQLIQNVLPLNPQEIPGTTWHLALNTAVSFVTNTNWQSYSGETAMSYLTQMLGLAVQNFLSAATGIAVAVAFTRGIAQSQTSNVGNFWRDLTRSTVLLLLPLSFIFSILLMGEGVIQNFSKSVTVSTLEGASQTIPQGPVASQEAIKQLGTNGGGFFNANSAHPYENPTPLSNFLQMWMIFLIPAALPFVYGRMVPDGNGEDLVRIVRQKSLLPIIVLTAVSDESSKVRLLEAGADDYLTKPFGLAELLARVRVALRHTQNLKLDTVIRQEGLIIDLDKNEVVRVDQVIHLTATEWKLLRLLLENPGRLVPTASLLKEVWGEHAQDNPHYLRIYMGHLRKKLEADPAHPRLILNETGVGYRWNVA